jgi:hypothetical protein
MNRNDSYRRYMLQKIIHNKIFNVAISNQQSGSMTAIWII